MENKKKPKDYTECDCSKCKDTCIHKDAYRRLPMESKIEISIRDANGNLQFADAFCAYTDENNGKNTVVITSR